MIKNFTFIDLFSGIGGFHSGLSKIGGKCVFASDILPIARDTYYQNYKVQPFGDITKIKNSSIPNHDILCAGFPCQSFSNIGPRGGLNDPRGEMVYEIFRILKGKKPKAFILENVKGLISHQGGKTFEYIIKQLGLLGYDVWSEILEAKDYGVPQIRKRLFIVGARKNLKINFTFPEPIKLKYTLSKVLNGNVERDFGFTVRIGGRHSGINNRYNWDSYKVNGITRYITPEECLLLQGFKKTFKLMGTESQKFYQVGNSVPVTIVTEIGKELLKHNFLK